MQRSKATFLKKNTVLGSLSPVVLERAAALTDQVRFPRRDKLWTCGHRANAVYWVRSGLVKVSRPIDGTRDLTLSFHGKGDLIGETGALVATSGIDSVRHTCAEAYEDTLAYVLPVTELRDLMRHNHQVAAEMAALVADRRLRLEERLGVLLFKTAHARLASLFMDLAESFGVRDSRGIIINLKLTHKEMAALIGATRETVSFAILDLRKQGLVQTEGKRVVLLDGPGLRQLAAA